MKLFSKFSGKKEEKPKKSPKKEENVLDMVKDDKPTKHEEVRLKEDTGSAHRILQNYHLSEKTNQFSSQGRYVFRVAKSANKITVKKAVEKVYDVHVAAVNIINTPGKVRRQGRVFGKTSDWKKAIVTLKTGEKITGLAEGV
jgi:large subunit ribosomal protein L23